MLRSDESNQVPVPDAPDESNQVPAPVGHPPADPQDTYRDTVASLVSREEISQVAIAIEKILHGFTSTKNYNGPTILMYEGILSLACLFARRQMGKDPATFVCTAKGLGGKSPNNPLNSRVGYMWVPRIYDAKKELHQGQVPSIGRLSFKLPKPNGKYLFNSRADRHLRQNFEMLERKGYNFPSLSIAPDVLVEAHGCAIPCNISSRGTNIEKAIAETLLMMLNKLNYRESTWGICVFAQSIAIHKLTVVEHVGEIAHQQCLYSFNPYIPGVDASGEPRPAKRNNNIKDPKGFIFGKTAGGKEFISITKLMNLFSCLVRKFEEGASTYAQARERGKHDDVATIGKLVHEGAIPIWTAPQMQPKGFYDFATMASELLNPNVMGEKLNPVLGGQHAVTQDYIGGTYHHFSTLSLASGGTPSRSRSRSSSSSSVASFVSPART